MSRWLLMVLVVAVAVAWDAGALAGGQPGDKGKVGPPLYKPADVQAPAWVAQKDTLRPRFAIPDCQFQVVERQDVVSMAGAGNREGIVLFVGEEVNPADPLAKGKDVVEVKISVGAGFVTK